MRTVLLADAAASVRDFAKALLEREDVAFVEAADATDALVAVEVHHPAIVFLDIDLPPCGGLEVLSRLRGFDDVPVVILALREHALEARALFRRGADEILLKPLDGWRLVAAAEAVLGAESGESAQGQAPTARRA